MPANTIQNQLAAAIQITKNHLSANLIRRLRRSPNSREHRHCALQIAYRNRTPREKAKEPKKRPTVRATFCDENKFAENRRK